MTPARIAELRALADAATPGPWLDGEIGFSVVLDGGRVGYPADGKSIASLNDGEYIENRNAKHDAAFIAAARTAVPEILDALDAAERQRDELMADWGDAPLPDNADISSAMPTKTGRHDLYAEAMRLVGARRSKGSLVALVNWLLVRTDAAERENATCDRDAMLVRAEAAEAALEVAREALVSICQHSTPAALVARDALAKISPLRKP